MYGFFFQLLYSSYSYKCYVEDTCLAGLTMIQPIIVNNWFNHYENNGWSLNHEDLTWCVPRHQGKSIVQNIKHVLHHV